MKKSLFNLISNIKKHLEYSSCYDYMEGKGVAIFGMCNGCDDKNCPNCMTEMSGGEEDETYLS